VRAFARGADRALDRWIGPVVDAAVGLICAALVLMVFSGVVARYVVNYSIAWSDELAGIFFAWLTLVGSVAAMRRKTHMAISFLVRRAGPRTQRLIGLYVLSVVAFFLGFMVVQGAFLAQLTFADRTPILGLPVGLSYLALPVSGTLMLAYVARELARLCHDRGGWEVVAAEADEG
jgi:TRAP-type C4-dicarboxylate transport system permease small subunit